MATVYSSVEYIGSSTTRQYRAQLVVSTTDYADRVVISWSATVQMKWAAQYGVGITCEGKTGTGYITSSSSSFKNVKTISGTTTVYKTASKQTKTLTAKAYGTTVSGYGSAGGSTSVSYSVSIAAKATPTAPSGCTNTRNSDTKNTVTWTLGSNASLLYDSIKLERSVDGGSFSQIASLGASVTSYADTTTSANHSYAYRVRAYNVSGYSSYSTSGTTYNTPAAPTLVEAARSGETSVNIKITNPANTATSLELQRSSDGSSWTTISTLTGSPVTTATDNPGGGTFYYRARNLRDSLVSGYSPTSAAVVTICAPAAPTLVSPASGITHPSSTERFTFEFTHNPIDGSAQTAAEVQYSIDGGSNWETIPLTTETQAVVDVQFPDNTTVTWRARTKGVHADFGEYSETRLFYVMQAPSVSIEWNIEDETLRTMPLLVSLIYDDGVSSLADVAITILDEGGNSVYQRALGTSTETTIEASEWLPNDKTNYSIQATVRSTSTLSATFSRSFYVEFISPNVGELTIEPDAETGYVNLRAEISDGYYTESGEVVTLDGLAETAVVQSLIVHGSCVQDGEPTSEAPIEIQTVSTLTLKVYGDDEASAIETPVDLQGYSLCSVEDISDTLSVNSEGAILTKRIGVIEAYANEEISGFWLSSTGELTEGATVYYVLEVEEEIALDTVALPEIITPTFNVTTVSNIPTVVDLTYFNGLAPAENLSVYRVVGNKRILLAEGLDSGNGLVDKYAPLNTDYTYEAVTFAESGAIARASFDAIVTCPWFFIYYGENGIARAKWNPESKESLKRPDKTRVLYAGRALAVSYDDMHHYSQDGSFSGVLLDKSEYEPFKEFMRSYNGRGVWKSAMGDVYHADADISLDFNLQNKAYFGTVSASLARIDGGEL